MSIEKYEQAKKIMEKNSDFLEYIGGCSDLLLIKAEKELSVAFPSDYRLFLKEYGALSFGAEEFYGIVREDFYNSRVPDGIWYTLTERKQVNMPKYLVVIYDTTMGELYCLNYNKLNKNNEPMVTSYFPGFDEEIQKHEVIAESFGDFLLDRVLLEAEQI
ncbi:MAG: SMI1/KNR4 family protein [Vagococcus sp.]|uniref:SMI1/KNR4 family protein n=1 Tax=Vagococcus sp. TaxID=1933889 RepID=UPI002FC6072E